MLNGLEGRSFGRRRALVVDGSLIGRMLAATMLAERDFEVVEAGDADAALGRLQDECFDLVLLDVGLPGMRGTELCQRVRLELGMVDLPIIAYTALSGVTNTALMRFAGFNDFLLKPISTRALDSALDRTFAH